MFLGESIEVDLKIVANMTHNKMTVIKPMARSKILSSIVWNLIIKAIHSHNRGSLRLIFQSNNLLGTPQVLFKLLHCSAWHWCGWFGSSLVLIIACIAHFDLVMLFLIIHLSHTVIAKTLQCVLSFFLHRANDQFLFISLAWMYFLGTKPPSYGAKYALQGSEDHWEHNYEEQYIGGILL